MHLHPIYKKNKINCPETIKITKIGIDIPSSVALDENDIIYIAKVIKSIRKN